MKIFFLPNKKILLSIALIIIIMLSAYPLFAKPENNIKDMQITILGFNDLGMHCIQPDYSQFLILPPGNNISVQVFKKGQEPELLTEGIKVTYKINDQDDPTKYSNFWTYAKQYGFDVPNGIGITGNGLQGVMKLNPTKKYWEATAIPVTSLTGGTGAASPYHTATITVYDEKTNSMLGEFKNLVVPVSPEIDCLNCHKEWPNILKSHDEKEKTNLYSEAERGILHRCSECHADPILDAPGKPKLPSLSLAIHGSHASKMTGTKKTVCFNCHPGKITECNRGVMKANNINCEDCHGSMIIVAKSIKAGRIPWFQEPPCEQCHNQKYRVNSTLLYSDSYLLNAPASEMNNLIVCPSCHNSPHAEWPSLLDLDNILPLTYQGKASFIQDCNVCHVGKSGKVHK